MRLLLDTHALIWWLTDANRLPSPVRAAISDRDNVVFVSAVSGFEISQKVRVGKLPLFDSLASDLSTVINTQKFVALSLTLEQASRAGLYVSAHKDPFDRLLIAQAEVEQMTLVSNETLFDSFGVSRLW